MNACDPCLARAQLLALLAPCIELVTTRKAGSRAAELLALDDADLAAAVAPTRKASLLAGAQAAPSSELRARMAAGRSGRAAATTARYPAAG